MSRGLLFSLLISACGYTAHKPDVVLSGMDAKKITANSQRIYIPIIDNTSTTPGIEAILTNSLRENLASVRGIEVVDRAEDANYLMLGTVNVYTRRRGLGVVIGTGGTEAAGALSNNRATASEIRLTVGIQMRLVEKKPGARADAIEVRHQLWKRDFVQEGIFEASQFATVNETRGSSSAVHYNEAREKVQLRLLANDLSQKVIDQVAQDF